MKAAVIDALKSALRVWVFTTLGLWIPGLLGWVNEVSSWAEQKGAPAFPDPSNLAFLFVAALTAAFPSAVAGLVRLVENLAGHSVLPRAAGSPVTPQRLPAPGDRGAGEARLFVIIVAAVLVALVLWVLLR